MSCISFDQFVQNKRRKSFAKIRHMYISWKYVYIVHLSCIYIFESIYKM